MRPIALVTGASSGLGAEFARQLARDGFDVVLVARRRERLEELAQEISAAHAAQAEVLAADLADEKDCRRVASRVAGEERLEILVNNAGFGTKGRFWEGELEIQEKMHRLHVLATMRLAHAALPGMVRRGRGGIINVSSSAAFGRSPGNVSYCATKSWMNAFTEGLALELHNLGSPVRVQALCPGFTWSEFHDTMGVSRSIVPASWWMKAEEVVAISLRGLERGKIIVVPGWRYRCFAALIGVLPFRLRFRLEARAPYRRDQLRQ